MAQNEEAERNDDSFFAKLFNRVPAKYIGINRVKKFFVRLVIIQDGPSRLHDSLSAQSE